MIQLTNVTKKFADKTAVNNISLYLHPGVITGFLGPNGAGKTTTMRMILGLAAPTSGSISVAGKLYAALEQPLSKIGAMVDASAIDGRLTPRQHLTILATAAGINKSRVDELLGFVGLHKVADKKIKEFSLGMKQRIGIAGSLIGDPETIMMDEPFNGLDVEGIHWLRNLLGDLAKQGKAVLISSHLLSEVQEIADRIIVLARGELIADMGMDEMQNESFSSYVQVQSSNTPLLKKALIEHGAGVDVPESEILHVRKMDIRRIGDIAFAYGIHIYELVKYQPSLEQLFSELVDGKTDYKGINLN
ncbi:ATP-binding cassette domain-containing protein [Paenibacillus albiflavus]|uniref:ATP-binding cassette domain-containing protein n=1 Tax=Paenibacillus albiflavus TaxID=2545760 RepID=A0A4R4EKY5_9BACL|nr:ATP-binding cassette domain-containing protein [Paenibacillus albiflavus]TCZ80896.1 ATP-binding cassette domain-containing protein [Paenibacillus albiflavus]